LFSPILSLSEYVISSTEIIEAYCALDIHLLIVFCDTYFIVYFFIIISLI